MQIHLKTCQTLIFLSVCLLKYYFSKTSGKNATLSIKNLAIRLLGVLPPKKFFNLKLVIIWNNTIKSINEISIHRLDWFENRFYCKPKLWFLYILAENHQLHVSSKFHQVLSFLLGPTVYVILYNVIYKIWTHTSVGRVTNSESFSNIMTVGSNLCQDCFLFDVLDFS